MSLGLIGQKVGMTRVFKEDGQSVPVTVVQIEPNRITQIKSVDTDGYDAIQVASGARKANRVSKAMAGHYAKAGVAPGTRIAEFRVAADEAASLIEQAAKASQAAAASDDAQEDGEAQDAPEAQEPEQEQGLSLGAQIQVGLFEEGKSSRVRKWAATWARVLVLNKV